VIRFVAALEGIDDLSGRYLRSLEKRVEELERTVERLESSTRSAAGGGAAQQRTNQTGAQVH
jgi:hypothetical protein